MNSKFLLLIVFAGGIIAGITIFAGITQMDFEDKSKKVTQSPPSLYEDIHAFSSNDSLGNYQKWCEENRGVWYDGNHCGFVHHKDALRAEAILEDLKTQKITGKYAEAICEILDIPCPENVEFEGYLNWNTNYVHYSFISKKLDYDFKILHQQLEFRGQRLVDDTWQTTGDEWVVWSFDGDKITEVNFSAAMEFDSDKLGNYEKWCSTYNGVFYPSETDSKARCEFTTQKDVTAAMDGLRKLKEKTISGELAQRLCAAYGKECLSGISITMKYDMETGYLLKEKRTGEHMSEFRIIEDDVIQYRIGHSPPYPWTTFQGD